MAKKQEATLYEKENTIKPRKTAFVLSGGGSRGAYQIGVWRALIELGWTFDIVVGVSVGSLNGAMVVQGEQLLAENLWRDLETDNIFDVANNAQTADFAVEFIKQGGAGSHGLQKFVDTYIDDQKVRESDIDFGLLVVETPTMKPHYLWKKDIPEGRIGDYVMASSSAFPAVQAYDIDGKKYIDGGFENVLPIHMAVERGATDIVAVYLQAAGRFNRTAEIDSASKAGANLVLIEPKWDLGNFLLFDRKNTARIIRLGYQDAMKAFGVYDGESFSFIKGAFDKRSLKAAEAAGKIFDIDPLTIYSKESFVSSLAAAVKTVGNVDIQKISLDEIHKVNREIATLAIAHDLNRRGVDSIFIKRHALRLAHDEILAARFIDSNGLL